MSTLRHGLFSLHVPSQAVGAGTVFFDLYNGSERKIVVSSILGIKDGSVAVSGTLAASLYLTRTSAVGTGGTEDTDENTTLTGISITKLTSRALPSGISARMTPTGGATAGAVICNRQIFTEETNAADYEPVEFLPTLLEVGEGTGIRIVQGAVASVGNIGFQVAFY